MRRKKLQQRLASSLLVIAAVPAQAAIIDLFDWGFKIDGNSYVAAATYSTPAPGDLPSSIDVSAFDFSNGPGTGGGLGTVTITLNTPGSHYVSVFFDHEIDEGSNTFFNEEGLPTGSPVLGQSWEIDDPVAGDIFNNFLNATLDNLNQAPGPDDVSMALGWNISLALNQIATVTFTVSDTPPPSGFALVLVHTDPDSPATIYLSGAVNIENLLPGCAILGNQSVVIREGSSVTAYPANICSNGPLRTGAKVTVDTSLWSLSNMHLSDGTKVSYDAFTNGNLSTGANVKIGFGDGPEDLDVDAGGNISLLGGTLVEGECQYGGKITKGPRAGCGNEVPDTNKPFADPFALPTCQVIAPPVGAEDKKTPPGDGYYCDNPLGPGDYGDWNFGPSNCVALTGGEYHFQSLAFSAKTQIQILGPSTLHVVDELLFADGVQMNLAPGQVTADQVVYLVNGNAAAYPEHRGGAQTVLYGTICGPGSGITIGDGSTFTGSLIGKTVTVGAQVTFTAAPAPLP